MQNRPTQTPDTEAILAAARREREQLLVTPPEPEQYVGRSPEVEQEAEALIEAAEEREQNEQPSQSQLDGLRREFEAKFEAQQKLIAGLLARQKDPDYERVAREVTRHEQMKVRQREYDRLEKIGDGTVAIMIHTHQDPHMNWDVPVSVNGKTWRLRRGDTVRVPVCVMEALDNARIESVVHLVDGDGHLRAHHLEMLSYPYSRM